jgi:alginate O-acetyltransferase complex protein AlgI
MLFTSYEFVLIFLPVTVLLVYAAAALHQRALAKVLLFAASLVFYAWWNPRYVVLLLALTCFNYLVGSWLIRTSERDTAARLRFWVAVFGVSTNVLTLGYFKYTNFFLQTVTDLTGWQFSVGAILLPLGISFITFQKIAFLVDAYGGQIQRLSFLDYGLFVSFFPQLLAGPIVHHREIIPQLRSDTSLRYIQRVVPIAITFFVIGAFKKVIIADHLSPRVAAAFTSAAAGSPLDLVASWTASLAFTLQIYFDFSGYSDMAVGLGLLFGIRLPFNFDSPLKATSMIDFWARWHMTLTRFLTAYIYNPIVLRATRRWMATGRKVTTRGVMSLAAFLRLLIFPTLFTMFITGLWHGAGWQFIVFGLLHGLYLVINHAWRNFRHAGKPPAPSVAGIWAARALTLLAFVVSMPLFRADSLTTALRMLRGMIGGHGISLHGLIHDWKFLGLLGAVLMISQMLPNTQELLRNRLDAATEPLAAHAAAGRTMGGSATANSWSWPRVEWKPTAMWALAIGLVAWYVVLNMAAPSEFLYFQF